MAVEAEYLITALILPIYPLLWVINRKIGKYDQVCEDVKVLKHDVSRIWMKLYEVSE